MAFDQNTVPLDLRPLNIARTMPEETRIAPIMTSGLNVEGFYAPQSRDGSPGSIPVYYPATVSDTSGFVGLGYGNAAPGIAAWCPRLPTAVVSPVGVNSPVAVNSVAGYCYNPNIGSQISSNVSDHASDEGGDDSASGKKVKFLCSFCGKILPRPSDGMLRYVGGHTRIISVRRDVSFSELVQKMAETYGQNVIIKYQLPDEDLDALVSVSCPDDLENMMDEYQKLVGRSSDGSAKLRVFLFSASELDSSGMVQFGDLHDSGQRYVEAVNGITDGTGGGIMRKESIASAGSTQNSEVSGTEAIDGLGHGLGDSTGPPSTGILSPRDNSATSQETASGVVSMDPSPAFYAHASVAPLCTPMVKSATPQTFSAHPELELERSMPATLQQQQMNFDLQQPGVNFAPPPTYLHAYVDPHQEAINRGDYVQLPSQMGFPPHLLGTVRPILTQQPSAHQFVPAVHMTMAPSSHVSMRPTVISPSVQSPQIRMDQYPEENTFGGRFVQFPSEQSYGGYQSQVPPAVAGGYGWRQVPPREQVIFPEGRLAHQKVTLPEKILKYDDCLMCQKALPHAHSDTLAQEQRESPPSTISDFNPVYHSLRLDDNLRARPMNRAVVTGVMGEGMVEQGAGAQPMVLVRVDHEAKTPQSDAVGVLQNVKGQGENQKVILQKVDSSDQMKVPVPQGMVGLAGGVISPYSVYMNTPQSCQENTVQQLAVPIQYQAKQETSIKPVDSGFAHVGGMPFQTSDQLVHDSPKDYCGKLPGIVPKEDNTGPCITKEYLRPIDGRMENLWIRPPETPVNSEQTKSPIDTSSTEDTLDCRLQQILGMDMYLDNTYKPKMVHDPNNIKPNEMLPSSSSEVSYLHNLRPMESYELAQQPILGNPGAYQHSKILVNHLAPEDVSYGHPAFSDVDSVHMDNSSRFQQKMVTNDAEAVPLSSKVPTSLSPSNRVGDMQDASTSLFSNQDPWNLQLDTHFPPPRPNKVPTKNDVFGVLDPSIGNRMGNSGESPTGNSGDLIAESHLEDGVHQSSGNSSTDLGSDHVRPIKGSAEELIKRELQAVAEGVAASVLHPSTSSNPDLQLRERCESISECNQVAKAQNSDIEVQQMTNFEESQAKMPDKTNFGFPVSDGVGRLQIIKNSDLEELRELGSGTFGTVYHGKWRGTDVAIKRINDRCFAGKPSEQERMVVALSYRADFWNEAVNLADLHHPNVVAFYGVVLDGPGGSVATVTEYMVNGSLRNALQKNERTLDNRKRLLIAMDVAFGMEYLHGKNIVHFDLKSDNLLVNLRDPHRPICKVGDLGLSKVKCHTLISGGVRGTLPWMAPELLNGSSSLVSEKVDVFSFGIVMWELLTGEEPYADLHYGAIIGGIVSNTLRPSVPEACDSEWMSLMERCWSSEPSERPNFTEIANQLRSMAVNIPPKGQTQQAPLSMQLQVQK